MTIAVEEILEIFNQRKADAGPLHERRRQIRDTYNGDVVVPLPELDRAEMPGVANLTALGLDQTATRIASVMPDVMYPPAKASKGAQDAARDKRKANLGWWDANNMHLKMYRRARWLQGYASAPVVIRPDFTRAIPQWELKDPLGSYPGPRVDPDDPCVPDAIFAVRRPLWWLKRHYPAQASALAKVESHRGADARFEVLEWVDHNELVLAAVGKVDGSDQNPYGDGTANGSRIVELERLPNRAGRCTAIFPGRINLDRPMGQFDSMVGLHQMQSRLMALEVIAVERGIFPDEWLIAGQGETPEIVQVADGRRGTVGMVKNGQLRQQQLNPGYQTFPTMDRLERAQRLNGGIPADFGGESASNIRTGRRGGDVLSATIDFGIQEAQRIFAASLEAENSVAIAIDKGYHDAPKSFYVSWAKAKGRVDYTPSKLFETDENIVTYAHAGADANGLVISMGQRVGMQEMSLHTMREMDPLIEDPEVERDRVTVEALESAYLQGVQARSANGELVDVDLIRVIELIKTDQADLVQAVRKAQDEAQERQAAEVPAGAPETMPGLAMPGMGIEPEGPIPEPNGSLDNLSMALRSLRYPQAAV